MVGHSGAVIDVPSYYYLSQALFTFAALTLISKVAKTLQKGNEIRLRELRKKPETNPNQKTFAARNRCSLLTRTQPYQIYIHIFDRSYPVTMQVKSQNLFLFVPGSAGAAACSVFGKRGPIQFCVVFLLCSGSAPCRSPVDFVLAFRFLEFFRISCCAPARGRFCCCCRCCCSCVFIFSSHLREGSPN